MLNMNQSNDLTIDGKLKPSSPSADTSNEECLQTVLSIEPKNIETNSVVQSKQSHAQHSEKGNSVIDDPVNPRMPSQGDNAKDLTEKRKHNRCFNIDWAFLPVKISYFHAQLKNMLLHAIPHSNFDKLRTYKNTSWSYCWYTISRIDCWKSFLGYDNRSITSTFNHSCHTSCLLNVVDDSTAFCCFLS